MNNREFKKLIKENISKDNIENKIKILLTNYILKHRQPLLKKFIPENYKKEIESMGYFYEVIHNNMEFICTIENKGK